MSDTTRHEQKKYYTKAELYEESPSAKDGFTRDKLVAHRRTNQAFVKRLCEKLKLHPAIEEAAIVLYERFFARRSYDKNDRYLIVAAALFLAMKAQDFPKHLSQIAQAYVEVKFAKKPEEIQSFKDTKEKGAELMEAILLAERAILFTLGFEVREYQVLAPMREYLAALGVFVLRRKEEKEVPVNDLPQDVQKKLGQLVTSLMKPIFKTTLFLQYPPTKIPAALVRYATGKLQLQLEPVPQDKLLELQKVFKEPFTVSDKEYQDIIDQLMACGFVEAKPHHAAAGEAAASSQPAADSQAAGPSTGAANGTGNPAQQHESQAGSSSQHTHLANGVAPSAAHAPVRPPAPTYSRPPAPSPPPQSTHSYSRPPPSSRPASYPPAHSHPPPTSRAPVPRDMESPPELVPGLVWNDDHNNRNNTVPSPVDKDTPEEGELPDASTAAPASTGVKVEDGVQHAAGSSDGAARSPTPSSGAAARKRSAEPACGDVADDLGLSRDSKLLRVA